MCSLAFTLLAGRATLLDRRLISPSVIRTMEMERRTGIRGPTSLLELAITHGIGTRHLPGEKRKQGEQLWQGVARGKSSRLR